MDDAQITAVIVDMDGVITQTAKIHARAWKRTFDEFLTNRETQEGEDLQAFDIEEDYRRYVDGKPRLDGVRSFLDARGVGLPEGEANDAADRETVCGLANLKNHYFHELLDAEGVEVWDDTIEQIDSWKRRGLKVAVISSSRNCEAVLNAAGLLERFDAKVDGIDLERFQLAGKPAPDMLVFAAEELGVAPAAAMVVEDALAGVEAGRAGRFGLVVGVARNRAANDLRQSGADFVVEDMRDLLADPDDLPGDDTLRTPSAALQNTDRIAGRIRNNRVALFLDYDGTLTPIVRRPEEAVLTDEMRSLLSELTETCTVSIVSGRDRRDVEQMVGLENLIYAGSHGYDIRGPGGLTMEQEDAQRALSDLDEAERELHQRIDDVPGAHVERKKFAIAVHFREVADDEALVQVERGVSEVVDLHLGLRKREGKKIFELQPDVEWDKGRAIIWLMKALDLENTQAIVIYIGDDVTDEDAFRVLRNRGIGVGIRVGGAASGTHAAYRLQDCTEVREFLQILLGILRTRSPE